MYPPLHRTCNKRVVKQPKLSTHYLRGSLVENFVVSEYRKIVEHTGRRPQMYFWRDNSGTEVDLIVERGTELAAVEIKSGATLNSEFTRSLQKFQDYSGVSS